MKNWRYAAAESRKGVDQKQIGVIFIGNFGHTESWNISSGRGEEREEKRCVLKRA